MKCYSRCSAIMGNVVVVGKYVIQSMLECWSAGFAVFQCRANTRSKNLWRRRLLSQRPGSIVHWMIMGCIALAVQSNAYNDFRVNPVRDVGSNWFGNRQQKGTNRIELSVGGNIYTQYVRLRPRQHPHVVMRKKASPVAEKTLGHCRQRCSAFRSQRQSLPMPESFATVCCELCDAK